MAKKEKAPDDRFAGDPVGLPPRPALNDAERERLRSLARRVAEIAEHPSNKKKQQEWIRHNSLGKGKPMVLVFPEGSWFELLPEETLTIEDSFWRQWEWVLRHLIYRWEHLRDDNVIDPVLRIPLPAQVSSLGIPQGTWIDSTEDRGTSGHRPADCTPEEIIESLRARTISIDEEPARMKLEALGDIVGDILPVKLHRRGGADSGVFGHIYNSRGMQQMMIDMCDRPKWFHEVMTFITEDTLNLMDYVEANIPMDLNNGRDYVGSGGVGYTDELPSEGFEGKVRWRDLWGESAAQELSLVSPEMHEEFVLQYQIKILARYGLNCYGCCEPLDKKFDIVKEIPRLRRVSISPWADVRTSADALEDRYIFSWKPNPAQLVGNYSAERIRAEITETLDVAKGCVLEMIMKDTHTVENHPERLSTWVDIAQELSAG